MILMVMVCLIGFLDGQKILYFIGLPYVIDIFLSLKFRNMMEPAVVLVCLFVGALFVKFTVLEN
jgi:hypothetical protein